MRRRGGRGRRRSRGNRWSSTRGIARREPRSDAERGGLGGRRRPRHGDRGPRAAAAHPRPGSVGRGTHRDSCAAGRRCCTGSTATLVVHHAVRVEHGAALGAHHRRVRQHRHLGHRLARRAHRPKEAPPRRLVRDDGHAFREAHALLLLELRESIVQPDRRERAVSCETPRRRADTRARRGLPCVA